MEWVAAPAPCAVCGGEVMIPLRHREKPEKHPRTCGKPACRLVRLSRNGAVPVPRSTPTQKAAHQNATGVLAELAASVVLLEDFEIAPQLRENNTCPKCNAPADYTVQDLPAAHMRQETWRCLADGPRCRPTVKHAPIDQPLLEMPPAEPGDIDEQQAREWAEKTRAGWIPRTCEDCGETYQPVGSKQKRCEPCRLKRAQVNTKSGMRPKACSACGQDFIPVSSRAERCNACKWDASRPSRSPEQLALDAAVTPEMLAQAAAAKRADRVDLRPWADLLHAALERLTGERMCAACGETADACRFSLFVCPGARTLNNPEIPVSSPVADFADIDTWCARYPAAAAPDISPEPTNEEEPIMVTETPAAPAVEESPEVGPLCECGCGQTTQRSRGPVNRGEWNRYADRTHAKGGRKKSTPPPASAVPVGASGGPASLPEQGPASLQAFVTALGVLLQLTPAQRQAALSAVAALEGVA